MFGYAFAFGKPANPVIGTGYFFFANIPKTELPFFFFHWVFAATATTIVSGAVAERTEFVSYLFYSVGLTGEDKRKKIQRYRAGFQVYRRDS